MQGGAALLKSGLDRIDALDEQIRLLNADKSDVYSELKAQGFDLPTARWIIKQRRLDPLVREERNQLQELYARAIGLTV